MLFSFGTLTTKELLLDKLFTLSLILVEILVLVFAKVVQTQKNVQEKVLARSDKKLGWPLNTCIVSTEVGRTQKNEHHKILARSDVKLGWLSNTFIENSILFVFFLY